MTKETYDYGTYLSPYTWRYGNNLMRAIWSENHKRQLWRQIWIALAQVQADFGLVSQAQLGDLQSHSDTIDLQLSFQIEKNIHHDLMAELQAFASQCPIGGGILHLGATSMDIEDNADAIRQKQALELVIDQLKTILYLLKERIDEWADLAVIGFTHLQPAAPTTLGYRICLYAQDLLNDLAAVKQQYGNLKGKGFKGAVGTASTYVDLVGLENFSEFEKRMSSALDLAFFPVTGQTYPRKQEYEILNALAGIGASLHKFAFDIRILQSPPIGEISEPFGIQQIGSSAMPFKRNPIQSEKVDSISRNLAQLPRIAWDNAANSLLERTLDDSANRRSLLPEGFLMCNELLDVARKILEGLQINTQAIQRNLAIYAPFSATEQVLAALSRQGANRQATHSRLRNSR